MGINYVQEDISLTIIGSVYMYICVLYIVLCAVV